MMVFGFALRLCVFAGEFFSRLRIIPQRRKDAQAQSKKVLNDLYD
jgi:hypothetical protein